MRTINQYQPNNNNSRWMTTLNRINAINSKYHRETQQSNIPFPHVEFTSSYTGPVTSSNNQIYPPFPIPNREESLLVPSPINIHHGRHQHARQQSVVQAITRSRVIATHNPAIVQAKTTPPTVYEIIQPVVEITPPVISQHTIERRIIQNHNRPIQISRKQMPDVEDIPSPPPLNFRKRNQGKFAKRGFCERCCACCSWWICCLICLAILLPLIGLGIYFCLNSKPLEGTFLQKIFKSKQVVVPPPEVNITVVQNNQTDTDYIKQIQKILQEDAENRRRQQIQNKNNNITEQNKTISLPDTIHPSYTNNNTQNKQIITITNITCPPGYFFYDKKCLSCPDQSVWNGSKCIKRIFLSSPSSTQKGKQNSANNTNITEADPEIYVADAWTVVQPRKHYIRSS